MPRLWCAVYVILKVVVNFDLVKWEMELGYCDCSLERIPGSIFLWNSSGINVF